MKYITCLIAVLSMMAIRPAFSQQRDTLKEHTRPAFRQQRDSLKQRVYPALSLSQQRDSLKQYRTNVLSQRLSVDKGKATQILAIQDAYKENVKKLLKDMTLSAEARKSQFIQLTEQKNNAIKAMLTPEQQIKMPGLNHAVQGRNTQTN